MIANRYIMEMTQKTIDKLISIGDKYDCELLLPPFNGGNNPFYCLKDIKDDCMKLRSFLMEIHDIGVAIHYVKIDEKVDFMEIIPQ